PPWDQVRQCCLASPLGKRLPDALYLHRSALSHLDPILQAVAAAAQTYLPQDFEPTLIKFQFRQPRLSWLLYPDFDDDPHPALHLSVQVDFSSGTVQQRSYHQTPNPPILHRKETLVAPDHPQFHRFQDLTRQEESLGLLQDPRRIGTRSHWQQRLQTAGLELHGHHLACPRTGAPAAPEPLESPRLDRPIDRHKAAIHRNALSRPLRLALEAGLLAPNCTVFDYGCGHGGDLERMAQAGYRVSGWDPYYQPDRPRTPAEVVNLGYVINVIEDLGERRQALRAAWHLTQGILIVSAQVVVETAQQGSIAYEDGGITQRDPFQKDDQQEELQTYIDQVLEVD
ncbi:DNA phosphorothioation-associated putative methyltransferase, partial [Prochlorothrix hollandica]|uniref:DNA phosphorothioation-associated putative methyltransferase n=1 Tax=Prochlorothrix hollandica TaxID=1223 RepID=UPI00333F08B5